jgi:hypothetical protein
MTRIFVPVFSNEANDEKPTDSSQGLRSSAPPVASVPLLPQAADTTRSSVTQHTRKRAKPGSAWTQVAVVLALLVVVLLVLAVSLR